MFSLVRRALLLLLLSAASFPLWGEVPSPTQVAKDAVDLCTDDLRFPEMFAAWFGVDSIPSRIQELEGTRVRIHGVMFPPPEDNVAKFLLIGDTRTGTWPMFSRNQIDAKVRVYLKNSAWYTQEPIAVEGVFRVRAVQDRGALSILYFLEEAEVRKAPPRDGFYTRILFGC